jgi:hypothetical protein
MSTQLASLRFLKLPLILLLTVAVVPLAIAPADAARIRFRFLSKPAVKHIGKAEEGTQEQGRPPVRIHFGRSSSSSSQSADAGDNDKTQPRPAGAAAAAAARARASLEAERAQGTRGSSTLYQPVPLGQTTDYSGGISCIAGC